jgi:iron complex outermembrane receptor protein
MNTSCVSFAHRLARCLKSPAVGRLGLVAIMSLAASPTRAQQSPEPNAADEAVMLPAVKVGATLRTEPLLTVPIAVAVIDGDQMMHFGLQNLSDIAFSVPSLTFRAGASNKDTSLLVRGVGTITTSPGTEPGVSTVVDGVVLARPGQSTMDLADVDHIEILRGPQGTLFGKNSSIGVVNVVTKDPGESSRGYIDTSYYGGGNQEVVRAGYSTALVPNKARVALSMLYDNYDGNVKNLFLGNTVNGHKNWGGRAKMVFTPTKDFKATVIASYINSFGTTPNDGPVVVAATRAFPSGATTPTNPVVVAAVAPVVASANNLEIKSGLWGRVYDHNGGLSAQLEWALSGGSTLMSISAYQHWYNNQFQDTGFIAQPVVGQTVSWDRGYVWFDQYSEELRLTSPADRFFTYVSGLYFQRAIDTETYHRDIIQQPAAGNLVNNFGEAHYGTHGDNFSGFGEGVWNFTKTFRGVTGLRLTRDILDFYHQRVSSSAVAVPGIQPTHLIHSDSTSSTGVSGRVGLQFDLSKDAMLYATYSRGYKGPAYNVFFNQTPLQVAGLNPEKSDSYELGLKTLLLGNRVQVTLAAFDTIYHDYQANFNTLVVGTPVTNLINAGQVSTKGVEADVRARVTSKFMVYGSISSINAKVDTFNTPPGANNIDGRPLPFAPKIKGNLGGEYRFPLAGGRRIELSSDYSWQSDTQFSLAQTPDTVQQAYGIWNATIALSDSKGGWRVALLAKNIADKHYASLLSQGGGFLWRIAPRDTNRYFGVTLHKDF